MTDIEQKALAMVREVLNERNLSDKRAVRREVSPYTEALCRAIERHEAFRQEVGDALLEYYGGYHNASGESLERFIIAKPDPLVDVLHYLEWPNKDALAKDIRAALDALGFEIREKGQ